MNSFSGLALALVTFFVGSTAAVDKPAQEQLVLPISSTVGVFANQIRKIGETPIFIADQNTQLKLLQTGTKMLQVAEPNGKTGWVEKKLVRLQAISKVYTFEKVDVYGYLDNPTPVYILDAAEPDNSLLLTRSFLDELKDNVDRETIERVCGEVDISTIRQLRATWGM